MARAKKPTTDAPQKRVCKERFISYPGWESDDDGEPVYGRAGWDHAQRAAALVALYNDRKLRESWPNDRLIPMLAGLLELLQAALSLQEGYHARSPRCPRASLLLTPPSLPTALPGRRVAASNRAQVSASVRPVRVAYGWRRRRGK